MSDITIVLLLTLLPAIAAPLLMHFIAAHIERRVDDSVTWTKVDGTITRSHARQAKNSWYADVRYEYSARGEKLRGHRICFGGVSGSRVTVEEVLARYPEGAVVPVYYDPVKPSSSTLERSGRIKGLRLAGWLVCGCFLFVLAMVLAARS